MTKRKKFSSKVKERAVRLVHETTPDHTSQWAAICSVAEKIDCSPETLRNWVRKADRSDEGEDVVKRIKELERENRELKRANEILRKASAFFAQAELDRPLKKW